MWDKVTGRTVRRGSELALFTMKVAAISSLLLLLAVLPAGCTVAQTSPTSFLFTDISHLAFLHWNEQTMTEQEHEYQQAGQQIQPYQQGC
jgi:hypothetical protein